MNLKNIKLIGLIIGIINITDLCGYSFTLFNCDYQTRSLDWYFENPSGTKVEGTKSSGGLNQYTPSAVITALTPDNNQQYYGMWFSEFSDAEWKDLNTSLVVPQDGGTLYVRWAGSSVDGYNIATDKCPCSGEDPSGSDSVLGSKQKQEKSSQKHALVPDAAATSLASIKQTPMPVKPSKINR